MARENLSDEEDLESNFSDGSDDEQEEDSGNGGCVIL